MIFLTDIKYAFRSFSRAPRLSIAGVLCIAIGIAATTAVVTMVNITMFQSLPFPDADRLVRVWNTETDSDVRDEMSYVDFRELKAGLTAVEEFEITARTRLIFVSEDGARRVEGESISPGYFDLVGVKPFIGRLFSEEEYGPGNNPLMVLSYHTWAREFNYDENIIGREIRTNNQVSTDPKNYTIIGVLPPSFYGTIEADIPDLEFWIPIEQYIWGEIRNNRNYEPALTLGKLKPGATVQQLNEELRPFSQSVAERFPDQWENRFYKAEHFGENWRSDFQQGNLLLSVAAVLLLLVAASNVAGLLLARTIERRREIAIRRAIGADHWRITRLILIETFLLVLAGGIVGVISAPFLLDYFIELSAVEIPNYVEVAPDTSALVISTLVLAGVGLLTGLLPALAGAGGDLTDAIKDGGSKVSGSREERRWGSALIIAEVAMTVVLILASTLLIRSFISLNQVDYGFKTENMLRMAQFVDRSDVPENELLPAHYARIKEIVKAQPGVEDVAITLPPIPSVNPIVRRATYAGMPEEEIENGTRVHFHLVGPDFFNVMEIPVIAGRPIALSDTSDTALVAVINENFAERFGGAAKALGQMIRMDAINTSAALREGEFRVVGVASHAHFYGPRRMANDELQIYLPYNQVSSRVVTLNVVANTDTQILAESLPRALAAQAPSSATDWVDDVEEFIRWTFNDTQFYTWLVIVFALSATLLMVVGLYAVLSQMVIRSIGEIGVRKSLGATYEHILFRYLKKSLAVVALGLAIGLGLSLLIANSMRSLLFGVSAFDPLAFVVTSLVLLLVAAAASLLPARRAAKVDPLEALRYE